ncbi:MAG: hypothetical protein JSV44_09475, partial [Candidatus Zixiibacteriota bacterium]
DLEGTGLILTSGGLLTGIPDIADTVGFTARAADIPGSADEKLFELPIVMPYTCGDVNNDDEINLLDILYLIEAVYSGGEAPPYPNAADVNNSGDLNLLDILTLIDLLYGDGAVLDCP